MRINTFFYSIGQGFRNITRNKMFSLASFATMSACIFMFGIFYILVMNFSSMIHTAEESVAVTIFFEKGTDEARIQEIGRIVEARTEVSKAEFVSKEDAWAYVKEYYFEGREDLAAAFENDNPVANSEHYNIYLEDVSMQDSLVKYLKSLDGIREVKESEKVADALTDFNRLVGYISMGIILILLSVAVFLISNTVSVGINVRSEEIGIMKLIGATDYLVRAPFVVEGMIIGFVGSAIPLGFLFLIYGKVQEYVAARFVYIGSYLNFVDPIEIFQILVPVGLILGVGIGFFGSLVTVRRHLKV